MAKKKLRETVRTCIRAIAVYPKASSPKSKTADINIELSDGEALHLAEYLIEAARKSKKLTIRAIRKPSKTKLHQITVTYAIKHEKRALRG